MRCKGDRVSRLEAIGKTGKERHLYYCAECDYQYSVTVGTIFHDSHLPLTKWFLAIYMICSAKKGISSKQLQRELDTSYKTAWYMAHRIRLAAKVHHFCQGDNRPRKFKLHHYPKWRPRLKGDAGAEQPKISFPI